MSCQNFTNLFILSKECVCVCVCTHTLKCVCGDEGPAELNEYVKILTFKKLHLMPA